MWLLLASPALSVNASAERLDTAGSGCGTLRHVVFDRVGASYGVGNVPSLLRDTTSNLVIVAPPEYCLDTAAATTAAFSAAMHNAGIPVSWGNEGIPRGDYCLSHFLSQCYPRVNQPGDTLTAAQLGFVHDAWKAVSDGVTAFMPYGVASDMAVFDRSSLGSAIGIGFARRHQPIISTISARPQE
jgi:hypothetical protein